MAANMLRKNANDILQGTARGVLILLGISVPVAAIIIGCLYSWLNYHALKEVYTRAASIDEDSITKSIKGFESDRSTISREHFDPVLALQVVDPAYGVDDHSNFTKSRLLHTYLHTFDSQSPPNSTTTDATEKKHFYPGTVRIDVTLQWNDENDWRLILDIGYQNAPHQWTRIPWWKKEGIANSNELIRAEHSKSIPFVRSVQTPTTVEALCAYLNDYFLTSIKEKIKANPDSNDDNLIRTYRDKDFAREVVHPVMGLLPVDYGNLTTHKWFFLFNTLNGPLQALMLLCSVAGLIGILLRFLLCSILRDEISKGGFKYSTTGWYVVRQLESWIIYFGLLGTLVYLSAAIMQLRIHPSTPVMQSIMATMSVTMAQAFLTTIVSSSLQRIVETFRTAVMAYEDRV